MSIFKRALSLDLQYTAAADQRVLHACSRLAADELGRDLHNSHRSIIGTLQHMYDAEEFWSGRLYANALPPLDAFIGGGNVVASASPGQALDALKQNWPPVWTGLRKWFDGMTEEDLAGELSCRMPDGSDFHFTRWQILRHMVNHSTLHRGQITGMLRAIGTQPPNTDLMTYYLSS